MDWLAFECAVFGVAGQPVELSGYTIICITFPCLTLFIWLSNSLSFLLTACLTAHIVNTKLRNCINAPEKGEMIKTTDLAVGNIGRDSPFLASAKSAK